LEFIKRGERPPAGIDDEIAEAEGVRAKLEATCVWLSNVRIEIGAWGYSWSVPPAPPKPAPPGPSPPER